MGKIKKLAVTVACTSLAAMVPFTLTGCKKEVDTPVTPITKTTDALVNTIVVTINGSDQVCLVQQYKTCEKKTYGEHFHYYDPIAKTDYTEQGNRCADDSVMRVDSIKEVGTIQEFLEPNLLLKLQSGTLSEEEKAEALSEIYEKGTERIAEQRSKSAGTK